MRPRKIERKGHTEDDNIPPLGDLRVAGHETGVDIRLLVHGAARLGPNLFTEVEEGVGEGGRDRRERETIGDGEGGRDEQGAVRLVLLLVEGRVCIDDAGDVVASAGVVERAARRDGLELAVPGVRELWGKMTIRTAEIFIELCVHTWRMGVRIPVPHN